MNVKTSGRLGLGFFVLALILSSQPASAVPDFGDWTAPMNLGPVVNSASADEGPAISKDGLSLYRSVRLKDGSFATPVAVAELNSAVQDARAAVRRDSREVFFFSTRPGSLGADLWTSTRMSRKAPWSTPANIGPTVNSASDDVQPAISRDRTTLFFASNRSGGSGLLDLYMSTREKGD